MELLKGRTLLETVCAMLSDSQLPKGFWAKVLLTAAYLLNRSPTNTVKGMNPYEVWRNEKPNIKHFKVCLVVPPMCRTPKGERDKFDLMRKKCIFFGYGNGTKGYRLNTNNI
jgi:hypothetical protein